MGQVANPHDIILWQKSAARKRAADEDAADAFSAVLRPEALDEARIEDLVSQHLQVRHMSFDYVMSMSLLAIAAPRGAGRSKD